MVAIVVNAPVMERPITKPINYKQYAGEVEAIRIFDAPDEVDSPLSDLNDGLASAGTLEEGVTELAALQNALICMHDALKAYKEHGFTIPNRLTQIHKRLEQRRAELDPKGPHL